MYKLTAISAFTDNYIWVIANYNNEVVLIDPGDSALVLTYLKQHSYAPKAILLTHHHIDHIGGVEVLCNHFPSISVYAPDEVAKKLTDIKINIVSKKSTINEIGLLFNVLFTPGHTLKHVSYHAKPYLFCGDTLFSAGCGRIFEGTTTQMFHSLMCLAKLDDETLICCGHEYTLDNLKFSHHILPEDLQIKNRLREVTQMRMLSKMTLPTTLALEKEINLFLRCNETVLKNKLGVDQQEEAFAELRKRKDAY